MKRLAMLGLIFLAACSGSSSGSTPPTPPVPPPHDTCTSTERSFRFANNTGQEIWIGITAGTISCLNDNDCPTEAAGSCVGANPAASVAGACGCPGGSAQCGSISQCNTSDNFCYWNLPEVNTSQINLANGAESTICFPAPFGNKSIQWSGNLFARTGCNDSGQNCTTGDCGANSSGICPTGTGGNPPASLAEFTLSNQTNFASTTGFDYYDVSIINGVNVAVTMAPVAGTYIAQSTDPYSCTAPGSASAQGNLTACSWSFTPTVSGVSQTTLLRDVNPTSFTGTTCPAGGAPNSLGFCTCTSDANCSSAGLLCGDALNASTTKYTMVCGAAIGWWSANQICGSTINTASPYGAPLNCSTSVTNSDGSTSNYTNFYLCTKPASATNPEQAQSCYNNAAVVDCCGCATSASADGLWPTVLNPGFGGSDNGCYANNPNWVTISQPWLVFLKQACPTAYSYPYDDATSTFTCRGSATFIPKYQVTFFPAN